ncbi:unnamed protein product [Porites evermanni]|uniref:Uncharacterized protein n=1 Tax=Porites evermanni TaxID=104178 RepID=A0ABN8M7F5_9CNID|nr:unnamed protein product [Porites evermanni]
MASQADLSTAADDKSASVSSVPASWSSRTKRKSKKCKKCGSMIQNLSCHQSDLHKMPMMKRKLDVYVTRKRKLPNQRIKFCRARKENGRQEKHSKSHEEANWQDEDDETCEEMGSKYSPEDSHEFKDEDFKMN